MRVGVFPLEGLEVRATCDIPDIIASGMDANGLVLMAGALPQTFFDRCAGFARELFQKLTNHQTRAVRVLPNPNPRFVRTLNPAAKQVAKGLLNAKVNFG